MMFDYLKQFSMTFKNELAAYRLVLKHPQTPWLAKVFLGLAIGYLLSPFDLIPDFIPILGQLDDVVIVPLLVFCGLKLTPRTVIESCREKVKKL